MMTEFLFLRQLLSAFSNSRKITHNTYTSLTIHLLSLSTNISVSLCENNINVPYQVSFRRPSKVSDFVSWQHDRTKGSEAPADV